MSKETKNSQKNNETSLMNVLMLAPAIICIVRGPNHVFEFANNMAMQFVGNKEVINKSVREAVPELAGQGFFELLDKVYATGETITVNEMPAKLDVGNGKFKEDYFNFVYQPSYDANENVNGIYIHAIVVTEQVLARKKIEESEHRFNEMVNSSPSLISICKGENMIVEIANDAILESWGKGNIIGQSLFDALPETVEQGFDKLLLGVYRTGEPVNANEIPAILMRNGIKELNYYDFIYQAQRNKKGEIEGVAILANEVTLQVEAKNKLAKSEKLFRNLVEQATMPILMLKGENMIVELANEPMLKLWQVGEEAIGKSMLDITPEIKDQPFMGYLSNVLQNGVIHYGNEEPAYFIRKNGEKETIYFNFVYQPYHEDDGSISGVMVMASNVTEQVVARKKIEESEQRYHAMLMNSPFAFSIMKGKDMEVTLANDLMKEFWGKGKNVEGKTLLEVLPELSNQPFPAMIDAVYTSGEPIYANEMLAQLNRSGIMEDRYFNIVHQPHLEGDETISGVITIAHEVTNQVLARKKIEESEEQFQAAVTAVQGIVWTNSAKGEMEGEQLDWRLLTGQNREAYQGYGWADAIHPDDAQPTIEAWNEAVRDRKHFVFEHRVKLKNGNWGHFSVKAIPLLHPDGSIREWVGVHTDITEQKEANNKAEAATLSAQEAMKAKQQFLSNMSHEIRTPMNAIVGFTNVVLKTTLDEKQKEYINAIKTSGDSLIVLINDILDLAKVDAGKMVFQHTPFKLSDCIATTLHLFEIKIQEKNIAFVKEYDATIPEVLLGDPVRLQQIFMNLINNAIKFTEKGHITVRTRLLNEDNEQATIEFSISDTGVGIAKNKLNNIFGAFEQAHSNSSLSYGGTGLGLSIVKQLVEHQGGSVSVKSKEGEGSTFGFVLSFEKTEAEAATKAATEGTSTLKNLKILVVEDVKLNQLLIRILLEDFGVEVDMADNGKIAIEKLKITHYDIILMDLQMPEMNGFEATAYIRNQLNSNIPIIALTADVTTVDVEKCKAVGMNDYISKPIDEKLLYEKIIKYLPKPNQIKNKG